MRLHTFRDWSDFVVAREVGLTWRTQLLGWPRRPRKLGKLGRRGTPRWVRRRVGLGAVRQKPSIVVDHYVFRVICSLLKDNLTKSFGFHSYSISDIAEPFKHYMCS